MYQLMNFVRNFTFVGDQELYNYLSQVGATLPV